MSAQQSAKDGDYDEWVKKKRADVLAAIGKDPSLLDEVAEVREMRQAIPQLEGALVAAKRDFWTVEGMNSQYKDYIDSGTRTAIGSDMMSKMQGARWLVNGRGVIQAGTLSQKKQPTPLVVKVAIVLVVMLTLGAVVAAITNASSPYASLITGGPGGFPSIILFAGFMVLIVLLVSARSKRQ